MKKTSIFSKALMGAAVVAMSFGMASCKKNTDDSKEQAEEQNDQALDNNDAKQDDSDYLVFAAGVNLEEIELGKLALQKSQNADVKSYAQMLIDNHTQAQKDLEAKAGAKNITVPTTITEDGKDAWDKLNDTDAKDFDKKYIDMMVDGHQKAIDKIQDASEDAKEEDVRMWAANMLPTLREHLEKAKSLQDQMKNM